MLKMENENNEDDLDNEDVLNEVADNQHEADIPVDHSLLTGVPAGHNHLPGVTPETSEITKKIQKPLI